MNYNFYEIDQDVFVITICKIIEKLYYKNYRIIVKTNSESISYEIDQKLWTYSQKHFIPHGVENDPDPHKHPIFITSKEDQLHINNPTLLLLVNNDIKYEKNNYEMIIYGFTALSARYKKIYNELKQGGNNSNYYILLDKNWKKYE